MNGMFEITPNELKSVRIKEHHIYFCRPGKTVAEKYCASKGMRLPENGIVFLKYDGTVESIVRNPIQEFKAFALEDESNTPLVVNGKLSNEAFNKVTVRDKHGDAAIPWTRAKCMGGAFSNEPWYACKVPAGVPEVCMMGDPERGYVPVTRPTHINNSKEWFILAIVQLMGDTYCTYKAETLSTEQFARKCDLRTFTDISVTSESFEIAAPTTSYVERANSADLAVDKNRLIEALNNAHISGLDACWGDDEGNKANLYLTIGPILTIITYDTKSEGIPAGKLLAKNFEMRDGMRGNTDNNDWSAVANSEGYVEIQKIVERMRSRCVN